LPVALLGWLLIAIATVVATLMIFALLTSPNETSLWLVLLGVAVVGFIGARLAFRD
jgi:hypothetical protein